MYKNKNSTKEDRKILLWALADVNFAGLGSSANFWFPSAYNFNFKELFPSIPHVKSTSIRYSSSS